MQMRKRVLREFLPIIKETIMKNAIRFIICFVSIMYALVAACYLDSDGFIGDVNAIRFLVGSVISASMYFWYELDKKRERLNRRIKHERRMREEVW